MKRPDDLRSSRLREQLNAIAGAECSLVARVIRTHRARYPVMAVQDVYKLLYQAAMGVGHALTEPEKAWRWLMEECRENASMEALPGEMMIEPVSPLAGLVRVNLRPFLVSGGEVSRLWRAFFDTARIVNPDLTRLRRYWGWFSDLCESADDLWEPGAVHDFWRHMTSLDLPVVNHSAQYRKAFRPAYRVVHMQLGVRNVVPRLIGHT
ncbi:hypothetical protein JW905_04030 [bacterium]|nr:hypothetical protein [candidate division CSSED10-310 bacterium]